MTPRRRRHDRHRLAETQTKALNHPLRLRLLEIHKRARGFPLSVEMLTASLAQSREYGDVTPALVNYHLTRLRDAELLPTP